MKSFKLQAGYIGLFMVTAVTLTLYFSACSAASAPSVIPSAPLSSSAAPASAASNSITIDLIAQNAAFDKASLIVKAGSQVTINFNNKDSMPHNIAIYNDQSASQVIFKGDIFTGPAAKTYSFTAPNSPGTYFFRCDAHPIKMTGQFIVQ
jgi:plastocyanin